MEDNVCVASTLQHSGCQDSCHSSHRVWYVKMRNNMQKYRKIDFASQMWHEFVGYVIHNCQPCMRFFIASFVQCSGRIMRYHTLAGVLITCSYKYRPVATDPAKMIQKYMSGRQNSIQLGALWDIGIVFRSSLYRFTSVWGMYVWYGNEWVTNINEIEL